MGHPEVHPRKVADGGDDDLGRKRKRGDDDPGRDGPVVRSERSAAGNVVEVLALDAADLAGDPTRPIARGEAPAMAAVADETHRIADRIILLDKSRAAAVFEIVAVALAHERVADSSKVHPKV